MKKWKSWRKSYEIFSAYWSQDLNNSRLFALSFRNRFVYPHVYYIYLLRLTEHSLRCLEFSRLFRVIYLFRRVKLQILGLLLNFTIPTRVFGAGLSIAHFGSIAVNKDSIVGENCRLHPGVTIGAIRGLTPRIGRNCFIGPGAVVIGDIEIGDDVHIGPNAVVNFNVPDGSRVTAIKPEIKSRGSNQ